MHLLSVLPRMLLPRDSSLPLSMRQRMLQQPSKREKQKPFKDDIEFCVVRHCLTRRAIVHAQVYAHAGKCRPTTRAARSMQKMKCVRY